MDTGLEVLLVGASANEEQVLVHELQEAGYRLTHARVDQAEQLDTALMERSWMLAICGEAAPRLPITETIRRVRKRNRHTPIVALHRPGSDRDFVPGVDGYVYLDRLHPLSTTVRRALEHAQLRRELERLRERLLVADRYWEIANRHNEIEPLLEEYVKAIKEVAQSDAAAIAMLDEDGRMSFGAHHGLCGQMSCLSRKIAVDTADCLCTRALTGRIATQGDVFATGSLTRTMSDPAVCPDPEALRHPNCAALQFDSIALVPVKLGDRTHGLIQALTMAPTEMTSDLVQMLKDAARTLGAALERTQRMRAQRLSEGLYRAVVETSTDGIAVLDAGGRILTTNRQMLDLFRCTRVEDVTGQDGRDLVVSEQRWRFDTALADLLAGEPIRREIYNFQRSDDTTFVGEISASLIADQAAGSATVLAEIRNVSERVISEAKVRESEEVHRTLFEKSTDAMLVADGDRFIDCNSATLRLLGFPSLEFFKDVQITDISPPVQPSGQDSRSAAERHMKEALARGHVCYEWTYRRADGTDFDAEVLLTALTLRGKRVVQATIRDITEQKKMQSLLLQADRVSQMGILAAGVAHEINNPVAFVSLNLQNIAEGLCGLLRETAVNSEPRLKHATRQIQVRTKEAIDGLQRVTGIVGSLKTFSRVEDDSHQLLLIDEVLDGCINMAHNTIKYRARLRREYQRFAVKGNAGRLGQVFLNLLINAAQAIELGSPENDEIVVRTRPVENMVVVDVSDTGPGIEPQHRPRLFDPFFTTKSAGTGSGLGLAICDQITREHGGRIEVASTIGKGSTFSVFLPASQLPARAAPVEAVDSVTRPKARSGRILVVDDEEQLRAALQRYLSRKHHVLTAASGKQAQDLLERDGEFDIVICDLMMREGSGMDLFEWLEEHRPMLTERMLFVTGGGVTPQARAFIDRHEERVVAKPIKIPHLMAQIRALLA